MTLNMSFRPQVKMEGTNSLSKGGKSSRKCHVPRTHFNEGIEFETNCRVKECSSKFVSVLR
jgi:hypothetical protein